MVLLLGLFQVRVTCLRPGPAAALRPVGARRVGAAGAVAITVDDARPFTVPATARTWKW